MSEKPKPIAWAFYWRDGRLRFVVEGEERADRWRAVHEGEVVPLFAGNPPSPSATGTLTPFALTDAERGMASEWIAVSDRLPDHGGTVVCRTADQQLKFGRVMTVSKYDGGEVTRTYLWRGYPDAPLDVTHWFPLPRTPGEYA